VQLTFDDGPDPTWTPRVLEALAEIERAATFYVIGERARRHPEVIGAIAAAGHAVQLHCHEHVRHTHTDRTFVERDCDRALAVLGGLGVTPTHWRTPWGIRAPWTEEVAAARGLELVGWSVDTHDWRGDAATAMVARIGPGLDAGSVVLMHDGLGPGATRSGCAETVALVRLLGDAPRAGTSPAP